MVMNKDTTGYLWWHLQENFVHVDLCEYRYQNSGRSMWILKLTC